MRVAFSILLSGAVLAAAPFAQPAATAAVQPSDFDAQADAILHAAYPADGPGAAAIVMRGGRVVYARGRGLADVEARRPITPDTVFRLGSITKQFTAALILQLVGEGRISLDDPVSRFFPDYPQPGAGATVRQLLNHTSGIQSYTGIPGWMVEANTNRPYTTAEMIALFRDRPAQFRPGERWDYNNSGYVLLGAIVEEVTGKPWHEVLAERITRPLGLTTIAYGVTGETVPAMARGYSEGADGVRPAQGIHMSVPHGAGALVGTVGDLARWAQALHGGRVVPPALYQEMIRATALPNGASHPYGYGLGIGDVRGRPAIGHGGGIFGFSTDSTYVPSEDLFVAVFANSDDAPTPPSIAVRRLAAVALGDPYPALAPVQVDAARLEPLFGIYRIADGQGRRFFAREGKLYTLREGGEESEVFAAGEDRFFYGPNSLTWFRIERQADGAHAMHMHQQGAEQAERAVRTGPVPVEPVVTVDPAVLGSYVGVYATEGPTATIAMGENGRLTVSVGGDRPLGMRAVAQNEFAVEGVGARILFHAENGAVDRLTIRHGSRELQGRRTAQ